MHTLRRMADVGEIEFLEVKKTYRMPNRFGVAWLTGKATEDMGDETVTKIAQIHRSASKKK